MNTTTELPVKKSAIEIRVLAINTLYEYAAKYYQHEKQRLTPFIGLDIFKVDGSFKQKHDSPKLSDRTKLDDGTFVDAHYWFNQYSTSFDIHVKICINGGSYDTKPTTAFCQYQELSITLFRKENGKLIAGDIDVSYLDERYNVDQLTAIANEVKEAAKVYESVYNKMPYLFTDVFNLSRLSR